MLSDKINTHKYHHPTHNCVGLGQFEFSFSQDSYEFPLLLCPALQFDMHRWVRELLHSHGLISACALLVPTENPSNPSEPSHLASKPNNPSQISARSTWFYLLSPEDNWELSASWKTEIRHIWEDKMASCNNNLYSITISILQCKQWHYSAPNCVVMWAFTREFRDSCSGDKSHSFYYNGVKKWGKNNCGFWDELGKNLGAAELWRKAQEELL